MRSSLLIGVRKERLVVMVDGKWIEPQHQGNDSARSEFKRAIAADHNDEVESLQVWTSSGGCVKRKHFVTKEERSRIDGIIAKEEAEQAKREAKAKSADKAKEPKAKE